jgi:hypothetical protein
MLLTQYESRCCEIRIPASGCRVAVAARSMRDNAPMLTLQTIRQARCLIRAVLAWFVVTVAFAVAAPVVQPQSLSLICSAAGSVKLVLSGDPGNQGTPVTGHHTLDCVLCLALSAPPSSVVRMAATAPPPVAAPLSWVTTHTTWRAASPLFARGPPALT